VRAENEMRVCGQRSIQTFRSLKMVDWPRVG